MNNTENYTYKNIEELNMENIGQVVKYKPVFPQIVMVVCGCLLLFFSNVYSKILGCFFILFSMVVQYFVKDHRVMGVSGNCLVFYHPEFVNKAFVVNLMDIEEWNVNKTKAYAIYIKMVDGNSFTKETFLTAKADRILRRLLPGKETDEIKAKKNAETKLVFKNPIKRKSIRK